VPLRALPRLEPPTVDRAYCLGTASGSESFDRVSALRELVEEQAPVVPQCWGMSPELDSLAWQVLYSGSRCTRRRHQDRFRFGSGLGTSPSTVHHEVPAGRLGEHHRAVESEMPSN
jgi:hypothetical protein